MKKLTGKVFLIGAGPGDPGLFTLKGKACLEAAQWVFYDHLVNPKLLEYCSKITHLQYVGKQSGGHTFSQDEINKLLLQKAQQGYVVARLKGGDPYIFGRGAEEAQVLFKGDIPFEIVPGVSSAVAVPAYAGIPLTHRDFSSSVTIVSGHDKEDGGKKEKKAKDGQGETLVYLMGVENLPDIVSRLLRQGVSAQMPAALVHWGTTVKQKTVIGDLSDIVEKVKLSELKPPAVLVVGEVVRLRSELNWFEDRPLFGKTIVVTRAREQASEFAELLQQYGAEVLECPMIRVVPPPSYRPLDLAIKRLSNYSWIILTSVNAVQAFLARLRRSGKDIRELKGVKLAAVGPRSSEALEAAGLRVDFVPKEYRAEAILPGLGKVSGKKILIPRAMVARDILPKTLKGKGAVVDVVVAYETVSDTESFTALKQRLKEHGIDMITFASSSTVENFMELFSKEEQSSLLRGVPLACIGPVTAQTLKKYGFKSQVTAREYTIPALAREVTAYFREPKIQHFKKSFGKTPKA